MKSNDDGSVSIDLEALAVELGGVGRISGDQFRREAVARIQTEALLDIAVSLRVLAREAEAAMPEVETEFAEEDIPDPIDVGSRVVTLLGNAGTVTALGAGDGDVYADVALDDGDSGTMRFFLDTLTLATEYEREEIARRARLYGVDPDPDLDDGSEPEEGSFPEIGGEPEGHREPETGEDVDHPDEIDDDFDELPAGEPKPKKKKGKK